MSKSLRGGPPQKSDFYTAFATFHKQKDRGTVLMAAAWLDDSLAELLRRSFRTDVKVADSLLKPDRPLGSFAARTSLAYLLGLIPPSIRGDLEIIRSIRNDFAHARTHVTFGSQNIKERCRQLVTAKTVNEFSLETFRGARDQFLITCLLLSDVLLTLSGKSSLPPQGDGDGAYEVFVKDLVQSMDKKRLSETLDKLEVKSNGT